MDKKTKTIRIIPQDIIGTTSHQHARLLRCQLTDCVTLEFKQSVVGKNVIIRSEHSHIGISHSKSIRQSARSTFVRLFEELFAQSAFLGGHRHQLLIIITDAQCLSQFFPYFTTTTAKLPANGQYDFVIHILTDFIILR